MVKHPGHWLWNSYGAMIGTVDAPDWLDRGTVLALFGSDQGTAISGFEAFVLAGIGEESPFRSVRNQLFLGDDAFCEHAAPQQLRHTLKEINRSQRRAIVRPLPEYFDECTSRKEAMAKAYLSHSYSMTEIAEFCQVSVRTVSRAVKAYREMSDCQT